MTKIVIDPGHGGQDPGATGYGMKEKNLTLAIAGHLRRCLRAYDVEVLATRKDDSTVSLEERTNMANRWGADFFLSIHVNAGGGTGYEDYIYEGLGPDSATFDRQQAIYQPMARFYSQQGFPIRGAKQANFHVLRESAMSAVLVENLFIDHPDDAAFLAQPGNREAIARALCGALVDALGLEQIEQPTLDVDWKAKHQALMLDLQALVDKHRMEGG